MIARFLRGVVFFVGVYLVAGAEDAGLPWGLVYAAFAGFCFGVFFRSAEDFA